MHPILIKKILSIHEEHLLNRLRPILEQAYVNKNNDPLLAPIFASGGSWWVHASFGVKTTHPYPHFAL